MLLLPPHENRRRPFGSWVTCTRESCVIVPILRVSRFPAEMSRMASCMMPRAEIIGMQIHAEAALQRSVLCSRDKR